MMRNTILFRTLFAFAFTLSFSVSNGQNYYDMSLGNYTQNFNGWSDYATNWNGTATENTGAVPVATNRTTATTTFTQNVVISTGIGGNNGTAANVTALVFRATGTDDNTTAVACDLNLNFAGRIAGTLSFDAAEINSQTGDRAATLRVYYSTNGTSWTEITGTDLPFAVVNNVPNSKSISVSLPSALDNQPTVKLRFYKHNGTGGSSGSRPRISIDNLSVTSFPTTPTIMLSQTSLSFGSVIAGNSSELSYTAGGINLTDDIVITPPAGFEISLTSGSGFQATPVVLTQTGGTVNDTTIYVRFSPATADGVHSGNITHESDDATTENVTLSGTAVAAEPQGLQLIALNTAYIIDFDNTVEYVNNGEYTGAGFQPSPTAGQLNSSAWASTGMSEGSLDFGGTNTTGDYARGTSTSGVTTGGFYAFTINGNATLGVQPTGTDWALGTLTLKIQNQTSSTVTSLSVAYKVWIRNNEGRSSAFNFSHSEDNSDYINATYLSLTSVAAADGSPVWKLYYRIDTIQSVNIAPGEFYYLRWSGADVGGSGSRDEFALDDITVTANPTTVFPITVSDVEEIAMRGNVSLSSDVSVKTTNITSGTLDLAGHKLTLEKLNGGGLIKGSATSEITVTGSENNAGTLNMTQTSDGSSNALKNLIVNKSVGTFSLGNELMIFDSVAVTNAGNLASDGNLVIHSDNGVNGRVGRFTSTGRITGNVTVECYIPSHTRRYRMISPNTQGFTFAQLKDDIYITGVGGAANGFDNSPSNGASLLTYQESTSGGRGWKAITNASNSLDEGQGAIVFVRGSRNTPSPDWYTAPYPAQDAVTIHYTGDIISDNISPALTFTNTNSIEDDGWNLVGNPYPSQIDWRAVSKTNLDDVCYVYDPSQGTYIFIDDEDPFIASGQAFFVKAINNSPTISFTENCKTAGAGERYFKSSGNTKFALRMVKDSLNSDVAYLQMRQGASIDYLPNEDAVKFTNPEINFGFMTSNLKVQLNRVPLLTQESDTFTLFANAAQGTYKLNFANIGVIPSHKAVLLKDLFLNTVTDARAATSYSFEITNNNASSGNRFQLIIINQSSLPVELLSLSANAVEGTQHIKVNWLTAHEKNNYAFVIERSLDGVTFHESGMVKAANNRREINAYNFTDNDALKLAAEKNANTIYYRLKQVDLSGNYQLSHVVAVSVSDKNTATVNNVTLSPNPANAYVDVSFTFQKALETVSVTDITGKEIFYEKPNDSIKYRLNTSNFKSGIYFIKVNGGKASKLVVE